MRRCWTLISFVTLSALLLMAVSCGGNASATASSSSAPAPTPSPSPSTSPAPTPTPSNPSPAGTVIDNVQDTPTWRTCGACGNNGGAGPVANYSFATGITAPSEDRRAAQFSIAASVPFTNAYFYIQQPAIPQPLAALTYEFDLYIPAGMETAPQAVEFECQQVLDGYVYNFSWQALYSGNVWRIFDYGLKRWDSSGIPFHAFTPGTWHHIAAEYHADTTNHVVWHDALTVDGVRTPVNISHNAFFSAGGMQFTNAFQLDSNSAATPYSVYVDKMRITYR